MKKVLLLASIILSGLSISAQKIIENPEFSAKTANYVKITRIELSDTITKIDFEVHYFPKWWISISSPQTYIQNSNGGKKLYVQKAEGIKLNERHWTPASGVNIYSLYFPAIGKEVEKIDYLEESWKIFDIELNETEITHFIPEEIQGNWLRTDGSNEWMYGIYDDKVIYQSIVWDKVLLNKKGKNYELSLKKGDKQENIFIKVKKDNLLIGNSPENMELFSKNKTSNPDYVIKNNEEYTLPVFKLDTVVYKGFIEGYHSKMGKTGMAYVDNIIDHEQNSYLIPIEPDGSFYCKFPMIHPQEVFVRIPLISKTVYLEPGKSTFEYIDLSEYTNPYKNYFQKSKRERKSPFMGDVARVNTDFLSLDSIYYFDFDKMQKTILDMDGKEYKAYCLDIMEKEKEVLAQYAGMHQISKKALQIKNFQIDYRAYGQILSYNMFKSSAYRKVNKVPREQREIPLKPENFEPDFYDFIITDDLNNPISIVSGSAYNILINRIRFSESVRPAINYFYVALKDSISMNNISLTNEEEELLNKVIACEDNTCIKEITSSDTSTWNPFMRKHADLMVSISRNAFKQMQTINLKKYFGLEEGFATEIMLAQSKCELMKGQQKPFNDDDMKEIKENISNSFIVDYLIQCSLKKEEEIAGKLAANKNKTGYVINETPKAEADKLFDTIIEKYRGKVVFVDFWATWCGPCHSGMEKMKPLKEELRDEAIEFVYITNQSSPMDTWNMMVPDIKGEHYRVSEDEWNYLSSKFNISGIPHYVLVDKQGTVVNDEVYFASSVQELKDLFEVYMKQ
jgi:thiol-disulfide isomerase/thioredoxin